MGSNSDFQSELLRINGLLQSSVTELRYRCEVYRLSLRSICKVLRTVHKEQEIRLRCLTTSRRSYQAYFLNLSQKQALDRITNVVRKAATFINGYSLVDKDIFQPPPPKPRSAYADEKRETETITTATSNGMQLNSESSDPASAAAETVTLIADVTSASPELEEGEVPPSQTNNNNNSETATNQRSTRKRDKKYSSSNYRRTYRRDRRDRDKTRNDREEARITRVSNKIRNRNYPKDTTSKSINHRHQINSRKQSSYPGTAALTERKAQGSMMGRSRRRGGSPSERKSSDPEKFRAEARRSSTPRVSRGHEANRGNSGYKDDQHEKQRNSRVRATNLKEIHESKNEIRYNKARESLAAARNRTVQGQGVARKQLFSPHKPPNNNSRLNFMPVEKVRRIQVSRDSGNTNYVSTSSTKTPSSTDTNSSAGRT